jgi:DNA modification methylase
MFPHPIQRLAVEYLPIERPKSNPRNPKTHSDRQVEQIARSMKLVGFIVPLLVDRDANVIAGHGRLLAAKRCGIAEVPVIRIEHLTPAQAAAFNIADNRLAEHAAWDERLLGEIFSELAAAELDFSLEVTGFTLGEIDLKIEALAEPIEAESDPADDLPPIPDQPVVSQLGDLWCLGKHQIFCGSALEADSFEALMQGKQAHVVFTDPPGKIHHREFAHASGEMSKGQFSSFLTTATHHLAENSTDGSIHYICMDWRHSFELLTAGNRAYTEFKNLCVWVKSNAGMGSLYRSQHELICVFKNGRAPHRNNVQLGKFGRDRTNVWQYPSVNSFGRGGDEGKLSALHPTIKPVALVADAVMDSSARGDIVLDTFLGSGSTLIAAERVGRICFGMEIDPLYVDTAILRWQRHTGDSAILARTGQRFDDIAATVGGQHGR